LKYRHSSYGKAFEPKNIHPCNCFPTAKIVLKQ
jgi:hypothetical protein